MAKRKTIQDSIRNAYTGIHDNDPDKIYNNIPSEYKPRNYNEISDGVFNIFRDNNNEQDFLKNLEEKFSVDMSKYSSEFKSKLFKDIFKFGVYQRIINNGNPIDDIPDSSTMLRLINDHRSEIILGDKDLTDLNSLNDAQKTSIREKLLNPLMNLISDETWAQGKQAAQDIVFDQTPISKIAEKVLPALKTIANSPFAELNKTGLSSLKARQENFKLNHVSDDNSNAGVRYIQYKRSAAPTIYGQAAAEEKRAAVKNIAPIFQQLNLDLANEVMSPTQQTGQQLLQKTINSVTPPVFHVRKTADNGFIRNMFQLQQAKDNMATNGVMGYDYETIGDEIHEFAYLTADVDIKTNKKGRVRAHPKINKKITGLIGLHSEAEKERVKKVILNLKEHGVIEDDSKYILQRLWAIGKADEAGYIKQNSRTRRFELKGFFDVSEADMQDTDTIERGYQALVDIAEKQKRQHKVNIEYNNKQYRLAPFERDLLMPLIEAVDQKQTVMAYNGFNFDTTKLFRMITRGDYISDDAKALFYDSELGELKGYSNYFDPMIAVRSGSVGDEIHDVDIRQRIMAEGQTWGTNTATYIRSGAKNGDKGVIHTSAADAFKMMVTSVHSAFEKKDKETDTFFDSLGMGKAQNNLEKISQGSVLSFDSSLASFNTGIGGLMFTVDPITGQYRIAGNNTTISYGKDGTPTFNDKSFGSYLVKDAPYVITNIQEYSPTDIEALGKDFATLDSSALSDKLYGVKLVRLTADNEGMAKTLPIHLLASRNGLEALFSSTATYHGDIPLFCYKSNKGNPSVIKISDITSAEDSEQSEVTKYLFEAVSRLQEESEKKFRENIALKPLETWHNLNRHAKGKESLADILSKASDTQTAKADIITKLEKNNSYFGFKINSINHLENIIGAYDVLKTYDEAGIFSAFQSAFKDKFKNGIFVDANGKSKNIYDEGRMFAQFVSRLKEEVGDLVQTAGSTSIKTSIPKDYKDTHFQFDLSSIAGQSRVHAALDDGFSDGSVVFDIASENPLNSFNRKSVTKLTKLLGFNNDKNGRNRALRTFGKKLSNFYGLEYDVSDKADFEDALLNDLVSRMKEIRESTVYKNLPEQKKEDVKDTAFAEVFSGLDKDIQQKLVNEASATTEDVKNIPRDKKNSVIKADLAKGGNKYAVQNFRDIDVNNHNQLLDFIAKEIGEKQDSSRVQSAAKEIEENLSSINEMIDFLLDEIVYGGGYDFIERPGKGYFLSTGIGGSELNITELLPSVKWNQDLGRGQVYIGRVPIANMETAYVDNTGTVKFGRVLDKIKDNTALFQRMKYVGTMGPIERLSYIANLLQSYNKDAREYSVIRKDNEDLQKTRAFEYRDLYDKILEPFSSNEAVSGDENKVNPKRYRRYVAEQFIDATNNMPIGEVSNPEELIKWAQSFADIESKFLDSRDKVPTSIVQQQLYLREHMHDIFKVITSNKDLYSIFFNEGISDNDAVDLTLDRLGKMNIGTRHANKAIGYIDEESLAFEGVGGPHKRHENYAEKRNKTLDIDRYARYIGGMESLLGEKEVRILKKATDYQSVFKGVTESLGQEKKTYTGLILEIAQGSYKKILESDTFKEYLKKEGYSQEHINRITNDLNIYLGESSSVTSPYYAALNRPQSMQRIHASDVVPNNELRLQSDASQWQLASEFKRRKELDFALRLRDNNEKISFTYGNLVHVNQGQHILTTRRYPDSSQRVKAVNYGRVGMRYFKTIHGAQVEMSEKEINEILNTEENLTRIASAMKPNGRTSQSALTTVIDNILSQQGATRDYVLYEDFDNSARKILVNSQEKSMGTAMTGSLGSYDQRIVKFFNNLGLGGIYLDRKVSADFIDSLASETEFASGRVVKFNEESSVYQVISRDKDFRENFIEYRQELKKQEKSLKEQLKNAQELLQQISKKSKLRIRSIEELNIRIENLQKRLNISDRYEREKVRRLRDRYDKQYNKAQFHNPGKWQNLANKGKIDQEEADYHTTRYYAEKEKAKEIWKKIDQVKKTYSPKRDHILEQLTAVKEIGEILPTVIAVQKKINEIEPKMHLTYRDAVQIKLNHELKNAFGPYSTATTLQEAMRKEQTMAWDAVTGFLGSVHGVDHARVRIVGLANTTTEITKESHGEARGILTNIASSLITHYVYNEKMDHKDAIIAARKYFNDNLLEDNSPKINENTGIVPEGIRPSTRKIQQHEDEITKRLEGVAPIESGETLLEEIFPNSSNGRMRLVFGEIQTMADPEASRGHTLDKTKGFQYSTRINTSLDYRRYNREDIQNAFDFYKNKSNNPKKVARNIREFNKLYKGIAEGIIENGEFKMNLIVDDPSTIKMFSNTINSLNRAVDKNARLDENGRPVYNPAPKKITEIAIVAAEKYDISPDRAYQIYAQQSVARAHSFNKRMQGFYDIEENKKLAGVHTQMQLVGDKQKEIVEAYAQEKNLEIVPISKVNTSKTAAPDDPYSIYQSDNFIIDMGEDSHMWLTDKNGNKQRYLTTAYTANDLLDKETSQIVSTKMQDAIATMKNVYDLYKVNGKDANRPEIAIQKMERAMETASGEYFENTRILAAGKNSIANTSTKVRLDRSFNAKALVVDKLSTSDIVKKYGQEMADVSVYVGKDKAIELLGGEKHIKDFAQKHGFTYDDALAKMLNNMQNEGLLAVVKREPTNYAQSVANARVFYDANLAENQVGVGKVLAAFMKADSDGDLVSVAALTGKFNSTIKEKYKEADGTTNIATINDYESIGTNIEMNLVSSTDPDFTKISESTKELFSEAKRNSDIMAHSGTARMVAAKIESGYADDAVLNAGENIFKKWIGEVTQDGKEKLGALTKYAINGVMVNYDDVRIYNKLGSPKKQKIDSIYADYIGSDEYKKAAEAVFYAKDGHPEFDPNARLMAADQIAIANQYFKQVGVDNVSKNLMTAIRVNAARSVVSDKALSDSMQGAAGINNTYTNKFRNLIDELTNKNIANLTPHQSNILMNVLAEIDENGQAPKNHKTVEPTEISEAIKDALRMTKDYEGRWDQGAGKWQFIPAVNTGQAGDRFVDFLVSRIGDISGMKNMNQVVIPSEVTDRESYLRQELAGAINNLLPEGQRISGDYYYKTGSAYIQKSADIPVVYDTTNSLDPLKRSTVIAKDMAEQAGDSELYSEPIPMIEEVPVKKSKESKMGHSKATYADYTREQNEKNFAEPDYTSDIGTDTRRIIENAEEIENEAIGTGDVIRRGVSSVVRNIGKSLTSSKGILTLAGSIMAAGFIGGTPTAPSGSEAQQAVQDAPRYQIEGSLVGDMSPQINQRAPQGYVVNINASSDKDRDYISGLMQQTMRAQFPNQNISMSMNINDSSSNISFRDIANYMQGAI